MSSENLYFFYRSTCPFTKKTEPAVQCVEETGKSFVKVEVTESEANYNLYNELAFKRCRGVPYFFNEKTNEYICGATTCELLKSLAGVE